MKERWWSAPTEAENGSTIIVTGRDYMDEIIAKGKFNYRVTVSWDYQALPSGMPDDADENRKDIFQQRCKDVFEETGERERVGVISPRRRERYRIFLAFRDILPNPGRIPPQ